MGRQKIEMKRIERDEARNVCFSKRRQGLFNKAGELSILCGAMVAVVVFSPAARPFSFGSPSFKTVMNRFLTLINLATNDESCASSSGETNTIKEGLECSELELSIENEKKRKERLNEAIEGYMDGSVMDWLIAKSYPSGFDELQELHKKLTTIQDVFKEKIKLMLQERHPTEPYPPAFMDLALKYMLERQTGAHISSMTPNSNHGLVDGPDVNASTSSVHAIGTSMSGPTVQLDG